MDARAWAGFAAARLDRVALLLAAFGAVLGLGLALAYRQAASPQLAHAAVDAMPAALRGAHAWSATFALVALLLFLLRTWVRGDDAALAARGWFPRVAALTLLLANVVLGGVLAWDHQGWESWQHVLAAMGQARPVEPSAPLATLGVAHALLGLAALALLAWPLRPLRADLVPLAPLLALPLLFGLLAPPRQGPAPIAGLAVGKPDWPFLWLVPLQDLLGPLALPLGLLAALVVLAALPRLGQGWTAKERAGAAVAAVGAVVALSAWGAFA